MTNKWNLCKASIYMFPLNLYCFVRFTRFCAIFNYALSELRVFVLFFFGPNLCLCYSFTNFLQQNWVIFNWCGTLSPSVSSHFAIYAKIQNYQYQYFSPKRFGLAFFVFYSGSQFLVAALAALYLPLCVSQSDLILNRDITSSNTDPFTLPTKPTDNLPEFSFTIQTVKFRPSTTILTRFLNANPSSKCDNF